MRRTVPGYTLPARRLVSQDDAAITQDAQIPRSRFIGSWSRKTAFDAGYLVPILVDECLPGDHMQYEVSAYVRMSTPLFPLFSNQRVDTFFFFVPARILWDNWVRFMGEQTNPGDSIDYEVPVTGRTGPAAVGSIWDHMGIPFLSGQINALSNWAVNALPLRAYNKIYNAWFRDQNLISSIVEETGDGPDPENFYALRKRAKSHDYFTSALPWPQKFTAPNVPMTGLAPVKGIGHLDINSASAGPLAVYETDYDGTPETYTWYSDFNTGNAQGANAMKMVPDGATFLPSVYADLAQATGVAINAFRQAFLIQQLLERDARGGTRYVELIRSHFRVTNPDYRLQRPEYIGGGQSTLQLTPIAQTAPTTGAPLGALGAAGTSAGTHRASYAATEHGYIIGLINVRSELAYQQGLHRMWSRSTRYDFYWPSLAQLGEQAILRKEIYALGDFGGSNDNTVFGYQESWHEYRTRYSEVTGIMRSTATGTLDAWHLAQKFTTAPTLGQTFIEDSPPMDRVLAADTLAVNQQYLADIYYQRVATRPIPTFGTPVTLGRF